MHTDALTEVEQVHFHELADLLAGRYSNAWPALLRASLDGLDVAVVVAVKEVGEHVDLDPVAVLVDAALFERLTPPGPVEIAGPRA